MAGLPWIKFYTDLLTHPKAEGLSDAAWRALTLAWLYSAKHETDGWIPIQARRLIRLDARSERSLTQKGWLGRFPNNAVSNDVTGWIIHDWADHQETAESAAARRKATAERVARHRALKGRKRVGGNTVGNAVGNATKSKRESLKDSPPSSPPPREESAAATPEPSPVAQSPPPGVEDNGNSSGEVPLTDEGRIDLEAFAETQSPRVAAAIKRMRARVLVTDEEV